MGTRKHVAIVEAGVRWAERDRRVRALLLKGLLARGDADERSDVDFVVVARPGRLQELWAARHSIAEGLGGWLGGFDEVAWQAPHTFIGFCDGPVKVDFFFQEAEPTADPPSPDLSDFDVHAWDWLWAMHLKLRRPGHERLVYVEQVKFVETMLLGACSALGPEPWRGVLRVEERLPAATRAELISALPARPEEAELRRAVSAAADSYLALRPRLALARNMPLAEEVARQVLGVLRPGRGCRPHSAP